MIINLCEGVTGLTTDTIANALNSLKLNEKLFIYLSCSEGGEVDSAEAVIHIINNNLDIIEMVSYGNIESAGFIVFFKSKCHRIILPGCMGMFHQTNVKVEINESSTSYDARTKADKEWMKIQKEQTLKLCKELHMTDKEMLDIKRGKDVYFQYPRMQEMLKEQQKEFGKFN